MLFCRYKKEFQVTLSKGLKIKSFSKWPQFLPGFARFAVTIYLTHKTMSKPWSYWGGGDSIHPKTTPPPLKTSLCTFLHQEQKAQKNRTKPVLFEPGFVKPVFPSPFWPATLFPMLQRTLPKLGTLFKLPWNEENQEKKQAMREGWVSLVCFTLIG